MTQTIKTLDIIRLPLEVSNFIKKNFEEHSYERDSLFCYKGNIPPVAFFLIDGAVELYKNNKLIRRYQKNHLIAARNLYDKSSIDFDIKIRSNTKTITINRFRLMELCVLDNILTNYLKTIGWLKIDVTA